MDQAHTLQERLAFSTTGIASDDADTYEAYSRLVQTVKAEVVPLIPEAWNSVPITEAGDMNFNGWGAPEVKGADEHVSEFLDTVNRHFD